MSLATLPFSSCTSFHVYIGIIPTFFQAGLLSWVLLIGGCKWHSQSQLLGPCNTMAIYGRYGLSAICPKESPSLPSMPLKVGYRWRVGYRHHITIDSID